MKLLNYTTTYFALILLIIISIWAGIFYYAMLDEIYDSIDDGLDNQKGLIIQKAANDSTTLQKKDFGESDYFIREIPAAAATTFQDIYVDTSMYMQNEDDYEPVRLLRTVFTQNRKFYQLSVTTSMVEEDDLTRQLLYYLIFLYLGLVITILILNNVFLKRTWRPFYHLLRQLKKFRLEKPLPLGSNPTRVDEFKLLNEAVQRLLQSNIDTFAAQKQFIENASHELQTPLAISINKLETLAARPGTSMEELELLGSAMDHLERLTRINKSLLLLSRIENRQFSGEKQVNINQIIQQLLHDFADQIEYRQLQVNIMDNQECIVKMNPDLAIILLTNLIKNAIIHNIPKGFITIAVFSHSVIVENSGQKSLDPEKIFDRFHKETAGSSSGLGLAISKTIAHLYHFELEYKFKGHHILTVHFLPH